MSTSNIRVTGVMLYYYLVCPRKLWYFANGITLEQDNELVQIGRVIDEQTFAKEDKHIEIDAVINIDFIKSKKAIHEVKKSRAIEEASIWQIKYYLYYLKERGATGLSGVINYPLLKKKEYVTLTADDEQVLDDMLVDIRRIVTDTKPPELTTKKICNACAYYDLCYL